MERNNKVAGKVLFFFICTFLPTVVMGQLGKDTSFVSAARQNAYKIYNASLGDQINLFNGSEYVEHYNYKNPKGFPYFLSDDWIDGTINYDSGIYSGVGLMYDLVTDKVVLDMEYSHFKLELVSEKVNAFDLAGHHFVRVIKFKNDSTFRSGFYDLLYEGKVKAYARRFKDRKETARITGIEVEYIEKTHYYILHQNTYHRVKSRKSLLDVFADKKKELKRKMRAGGQAINFHRDREGAIIHTAKLYDELQP